MDDCLIVGNGCDTVKALEEKFKTKYLGKPKVFLVPPWKPVFKQFSNLMYLSLCSRKDIYFAVSYLSIFLGNKPYQLWKAGKLATQDLKLVYNKTQDGSLHAYSDADWARDSTDRKSFSGVAVYFCVNLVSSALAVTELKWHGTKIPNSRLFVDSQNAISLIKNSENSKKSEHIDIRAHFIKDAASKGMVSISYVPTDNNVADIFTKPLSAQEHNDFRATLRLV
ncbi:hypothetical protein PR048_007381 [Dryococelus australis]|uniref:Copia protein n=1 Tax=Dryococelus australis TaxID=614101 RepID=A0ABQ9HU27_9NEOP|nr:hypothetical protein PR048_007381 [Dryococelus australis]